MEKNFSPLLENCSDFTDVFELVKHGVEKVLDKSRAGLMLGLANLGGAPGYYLGAYYTLDSNMIVMNSFPLKMLREKDAKLLKPYVFHILLHEYLHSLGWHDEAQTRKVTHHVCNQLFGNAHTTTKMAKDMRPFLPSLSYAEFGWFPKQEPELFILRGFDKGHLTYVA